MILNPISSQKNYPYYPGFQRLSNDVLRRKPDIVLIEFGGNDCDYRWDRIAENPSGEFQPKTECSAFYDLLTGLVKELHSMKIVPVLVSLPPLDPDRYFRWISHNSDHAKHNYTFFPFYARNQHFSL